MPRRLPSNPPWAACRSPTHSPRGSAPHGRSPEYFSEEGNQARPAAPRCRFMVEYPVDADLVGLGIGETVPDVAVTMDLPVGAGLGQLLAQRHHILGRYHRVVPTVEGGHFGLD